MSDEYEEQLEASSASNRRIVGLIIASIVVGVAGIFVFQNTDEANVEFLFLSGRAPLYVIIVISMLLGALLTLVAFGVRRRRRRHRSDS